MKGVRVRAGVAPSTVASEGSYDIKLVITEDPLFVLGSLVSLNKANALEGTHMACSAIRFGIQLILYTDIC